MSEEFDADELARLAGPAGEAELLDRLRAFFEGDRHPARRLVEALVDVGWRPTQGAAEEVVGWCLEAGEVDLADAVVAHMRRSGVTVTRSLRAQLVEAWARAGRAAAAQAVFDEMVECGDDPGAFLHQVVMAAWAKAGASRNVERLFRHLLAGGRSADAYHHRYVVEAYARAGELDAALGRLRDMRAVGFSPGGYEYRMIADACRKHRDPLHAEALRAAIVEAGEEPTAEVEEAVIVTWARTRVSDQARAAFERVKPSRRTAGHTWALMLACVRDGHLDDAEAALQAMLDAGIVAETRHYRLLVEAHRRRLADTAPSAGDTDAIVGLLEDAHTRRVALDRPTYASAADALASRGRSRAVREIIAAATLWGPRPNRHLYRALIEAELTAGALARAADTLADMRDAGLAPSAEDIDAVADAFERAGDPQRAAAVRRGRFQP